MGTAILTVRIVFLIRQIKHRTNEEYREKYDIERSDERNRYLSGKAWAWAGYLFVMIAVSIMLKIAGREEFKEKILKGSGEKL